MKDRLPNGWEWKMLEYVCDRGSSNISQNQIQEDHGDFPIYGASGFIKNVSFYHQSKPYIGIVKDGAGVGRIMLLNAKTSVIGTLQYLIPRESVDIKYLYYFLLGIDFSKYISGSTIPHIYYKNYKNEPFLLVPLPEQKQIVSVLDKTFEKLDQAIALVEENIQKLKQLNESVLDEVFATKRNRFKIGDILTLKRGYDLPTQGRVNGKIPIVGANGIVGFHNEAKIIGGGVVTGRSGSIGLVHYFEDDFWALNTSLYVRDYKGNLSKYCYYLLKANSEKIKRQATYSAVPTLDRKNVQEKILTEFHQNISEQQRIVAYLDQTTGKNQQLIAHYQNRLEQLKKLKNSVLDSAFKGALRRTVNEIETPTILETLIPSLNSVSEVANLQHAIIICKTKQILGSGRGKVYMQKTFANLQAVKNATIPYEFKMSNYGDFSWKLSEDLDNNPYLITVSTINKDEYIYEIKQDSYKEITKAMMSNKFSAFTKSVDELLRVYQDDLIRGNTDRVELLNTVLRAIKETNSTIGNTIYQFMSNWKISQKGYKTKADKFNPHETFAMIDLVKRLGWDKKLIKIK